MTDVLQIRALHSTTAIVVDLLDLVDDNWLHHLAELIRQHSSSDIAEGVLPPPDPVLEPLTAGALVMDRAGMTTLLDGRELELTRQEFHLLRVFLEHAGRALTRRQLMRLGWTSTTRAPAPSTFTSDACASSWAAKPPGCERCAVTVTGSTSGRRPCEPGDDAATVVDRYSMLTPQAVGVISRRV